MDFFGFRRKKQQFIEDAVNTASDIVMERTDVVVRSSKKKIFESILVIAEVLPIFLGLDLNPVSAPDLSGNITVNIGTINLINK